jgi:hypothetical protein
MHEIYNQEWYANLRFAKELYRVTDVRGDLNPVVIFKKYPICTVKLLSLEPHEGVPLELAQFIAFPQVVTPNKGECAKGLLL